MNIAWGNFNAGLQSVLDTALDAVVVMGDDGVIIGWNSSAERMFGWTAAEAIGQLLSATIVPQVHRKNHENGLSHYLQTGEGPVLGKRIEVPARRRDGSEIPVELSINATEQFGARMYVGFLRDISDRHEAAERQQRVLQESEHRVKNMLTAHQLLVGRAVSDVALTALAEQVLGADVAQGRARFGGPEILLEPGQLLGLSMILHELYTNAVKYGALCGEDGDVALDWDIEGDDIAMRWIECGPACEPEGTSSGFGQRMIALSVKSDLGGTIERDWRPEGLTVMLRFPLKRT
jgi:PAS domain S-box-containing protein